MNHKLLSLVSAFALAGMLGFASNTFAQTPPAEVTEEGVVVGTMQIDFATRTNPDTSGDLKKGSPAKGIKDKYTLALSVAKTVEFSGTVERQPKLFSSVLGRTVQPGQLYYNVNIAVVNPKNLAQKKTVGKWVGEVPADPATGIYDLSGGKANNSALRIAIDAIGQAEAFTDPFAGKLVGKAEKKEGLGSRLYSRVVNGKEVKITVKRADPMKFQGIELAKGPATVYPRTIVNGSLDYDYETYNYLTDGIVFSYNLDGKEYTDKVTGSIKWVPDANYDTNGKGYYDFNLRFNEEKFKPAQTEAAAFEGQAAEDAFFSVDTTIPTLTGKIEYVDTLVDGETVTASKITYNLSANKLTKPQIVNFMKLWLIAIGPTNDD